MKRLLIVLALLLLIAAAAAVFIAQNTPRTTLTGISENYSVSELERGGQISIAPVTPLPTGPAEPTVPPQATIPVLKSIPATSSSNLPNAAPLATQPLPVATPVPLPTSTPLPQEGIIPFKIKIPDIGVDTFVERVGVASDGTMDVPKNIWNTGWFGEGGFRPGTAGNAVIDGHLDAPGSRAVFWDLNKLKSGDKVYLTDTVGKQLVFEVVRSQAFPFDKAPLVEIFGPSNEPHLNLITCGGTFDRTSQNYNKRLIVFTKLIQ